MCLLAFTRTALFLESAAIFFMAMIASVETIVDSIWNLKSKSNVVFSVLLRGKH